MNGIKNILFDMGGVLIDLARINCVNAYKALGFENVESFLGDYGQKGPFLQLEEGSISENQFYEEIREEIPQASDEQIAQAFCQFVDGIPQYKLDMLLELKQRGFRLMLLSNTNPIIFPYVCKKFFEKEGLTVRDYFSDLFLSYEIGAIKPDPNAFREVVKRSGVIPEETLFIDDSQANLDSAAQFGFETYLAAPRADFSHIFTCNK